MGGEEGRLGLLVTLLTFLRYSPFLFGFLKKITFYEGRDQMPNERLAKVESEQLTWALLLGQPKAARPELPGEGPPPAPSPRPEVLPLLSPREGVGLGCSYPSGSPPPLVIAL